MEGENTCSAEKRKEGKKLKTQDLIRYTGMCAYCMYMYSTCPLRVIIFAKPTERVCQRERICFNWQCSLAYKRRWKEGEIVEKKGRDRESSGEAEGGRRERY